MTKDSLNCGAAENFYEAKMRQHIRTLVSQVLQMFAKVQKNGKHVSVTTF